MFSSLYSALDTICDNDIFAKYHNILIYLNNDNSLIQYKLVFSLDYIYSIRDDDVRCPTIQIVLRRDPVQ